MAAAAGGLGGGGMGDGRFSVLGPNAIHCFLQLFQPLSLFVLAEGQQIQLGRDLLLRDQRECCYSEGSDGMIHIPAAFGQSHGGLTDFSGQIAGGVQPLLPDDIPKGGVPYGK